MSILAALCLKFICFWTHLHSLWNKRCSWIMVNTEPLPMPTYGKSSHILTWQLFRITSARLHLQWWHSKDRRMRIVFYQLPALMEPIAPLKHWHCHNSVVNISDFGILLHKKFHYNLLFFTCSKLPSLIPFCITLQGKWYGSYYYVHKMVVPCGIQNCSMNKLYYQCVKKKISLYTYSTTFIHARKNYLTVRQFVTISHICCDLHYFERLIQTSQFSYCCGLLSNGDVMRIASKC